ncbi:MAG: methylated-DNA--[protein]-cysteine S-methyltransferase [Actinobacteria bacterium]|nr:methylated-DNA--[protein]-cysteine S-methyltransferase [Actinomycetota bacterium]
MTGPFVPPDPAAQHYCTQVGSPIGELLLIGRADALTGLYMLGGPHGSNVQRPPGTRRDETVFAAVAAQLEDYFDGRRSEFDVPLSPTGSPFQLEVWAELTRIPYGTTISYGELARRIGKPLSSSRAVGAANGQNPISLIVPCHRVIGADGSLTGYGGGLDRKEKLLRLEEAPAMIALDATLF